MKVRHLTEDGREFVHFKCPGCGDEHRLPVRRDQSRTATPEWWWNGSTKAPTLQPSILTRCGPITDPEHRATADDQWNAEGYRICHSFVTDGRIQFLGDCTHELAGQTVDLPEVSG